MSSFLHRAGDSVRRLAPPPRRRGRRPAGVASLGAFGTAPSKGDLIDLTRRHDELGARVAEMQWDLGGLVYEMAIRDSIRVDVLVRKAAELQGVESELHEVERILRLEQSATAGECPNCGSPHSTGATYCWQCGQPLMQQISPETITAP